LDKLAGLAIARCNGILILTWRTVASYVAFPDYVSNAGVWVVRLTKMSPGWCRKINYPP